LKKKGAVRNSKTQNLRTDRLAKSGNITYEGNVREFDIQTTVHRGIFL